MTTNNLTETWKKGKLEDGYYYFRHNNNSTPFAWFGSKKVYDGYSNDEVKEVLAPVPSYEEWQSLNELVDSMNDTYKAFAHMLSPFTDDYFNGLTTKDIAELAKKSIRLTTQHCEDNAEIDKLKELLKECSPYVSRSATSRMIKNSVGHKKDMKLFTKIDEVLGEK